MTMYGLHPQGVGCLLRRRRPPQGFEPGAGRNQNTLLFPAHGLPRRAYETGVTNHVSSIACRGVIRGGSAGWGSRLGAIWATASYLAIWSLP